MSLDSVRYQDSAVRMLRAAVAGDHVSHAYLFSGPRGVGKSLAARAFARLLLCSKPRGKGEQIDACGQCDNCKRMDRGVHPDLYWFRKEDGRNDFHIAQVVRGRGKASEEITTTVTESVVLHPMQAGRTVTVLDDAELLNRAAANALLKTLEEPAAHAVLILLCADPTQLPGTILSRCQWVRFNALPDEFVAEKLKGVLAARAAEEPSRSRKAVPLRPVSPDEVAFVCRFAGGSIEQASRLAGSGLWDLKRQIISQLPTMDEASALDMAEAVNEWARALVKQEHVKADTPEANAIRRSASRLALAAAASAMRDAALVAAGAAGDVRLTNSDQPQSVRELAAWGVEACTRAVGILAEGQAFVGRYVHTELATENALIQTSRLRPTLTLDRK